MALLPVPGAVTCGITPSGLEGARIQQRPLQVLSPPNPPRSHPPCPQKPLLTFKKPFHNPPYVPYHLARMCLCQLAQEPVGALSSWRRPSWLMVATNIPCGLFVTLWAGAGMAAPAYCWFRIAGFDNFRPVLSIKQAYSIFWQPILSHIGLQHVFLPSWSWTGCNEKNTRALFFWTSLPFAMLSLWLDVLCLKKSFDSGENMTNVGDFTWPILAIYFPLPQGLWNRLGIG